MMDDNLINYDKLKTFGTLFLKIQWYRERTFPIQSIEPFEHSVWRKIE